MGTFNVLHGKTSSIWHLCSTTASESNGYALKQRQVVIGNDTVHYRGVQPVAYRPKVARELKFCDLQNGPDFKASITVLKGITNLLWVASELSNP